MEKTDEQLVIRAENIEYDHFELKTFTHSDMYEMLGFIPYVQWILGNIKSYLPKRFYTIKTKPPEKVEEGLIEGLCLEAKLNQQ